MSCIDVTLPPLDEHRPLLLVAAALLIDGKNRVLLAKRPVGKPMPGLWEFPGGKVNAGELPEMALVRELKEELGIDTSPGCFLPLTFASYAYDDFHLLMPVFACRIWQGSPQPHEGQSLEWVPKQEWKNYVMPPADDQLLPILFELI